MTFDFKKNRMLEITRKRMAEKRDLAKGWGRRGGPADGAIEELHKKYTKDRPSAEEIPF